MIRLAYLSLVAFFLLCIASLSRAEEITITTYYPAPYGSYNELQLYPHSPSTVPCDASHVGVMYYDSSEDTLKICNSGSAWNSPGYWVLENAIPPATGEVIHPKDLAWNVGIGVAAPTYKLDVGAASGQAAFYAHTAENRAITAETTDNSAVFASSTGSSGIGVQAWGDGFDFYSNNAMGKSYLSGSLGIGIDAPLAKLHVRDGDAYFDGKVGIGTNSPASLLSVGTSGIGSAAISAYGVIGVFGRGSDQGVRGYSENFGVTGGSTNYIGVHGHGYRYGVYGSADLVGIGAYSSGYAGVTGTGGFYGIYGLGDHYGVYGEGGDYGVYGMGGDYGVMGYSSSDIGVCGVSSSNYGIYCVGAVCGGTQVWSSSSDSRLKTDIITIPDALAKVQRLRGVSFKWKDRPDKGPELGFVAQEAIEVVPGLVDKDKDGYYTMKQSEITALLVEAIKAQQQEINALKEKIDKLQK